MLVTNKKTSSHLTPQCWMLGSKSHIELQSLPRFKTSFRNRKLGSGKSSNKESTRYDVCSDYTYKSRPIVEIAILEFAQFWLLTDFHHDNCKPSSSLSVLCSREVFTCSKTASCKMPNKWPLRPRDKSYQRIQCRRNIFGARSYQRIRCRRDVFSATYDHSATCSIQLWAFVGIDYWKMRIHECVHHSRMLGYTRVCILSVREPDTIKKGSE